jgi:V/A-type H+-transporting ATPase subunit B
MPLSEYIGISEVNGPFILLESTPDAFFGELVDVCVPSGKIRRGRVVSLSDKTTLVQVFGGTDSIVPSDTRVRFLDRALEVQLAPNIVGRTFNGLGEPTDGCGPVFGGRRVDANGMPLNPMARQYPRDFIHTGISAIDTLTTLIRGQKLPIFSGNGLPHNQLAVQIATQARLMTSENFAVVFAGIGIKHDDAEFFLRELSEKGRSNNIVTFLNLADDPVIERIATPRMALSAAEYMAYELGMHVLVIITDMTSYCEALRELGVAAGEVPSRKGYPAYLYSDLASLYERAGVVRGISGSVTQLPILTMPNDDITHPIPDLPGFITEGQIVLSRDLDGKGIYPPIDVLTSLSRLMKDGIGKGFTRDDHPGVASQLFASYSRVQDVRSLAGVVGEDELSKTDKLSLEFGGFFEDKFLRQGTDEDREIGYSLDMAWEILATLPKGDLTRLSLDEIKEHIKERPSSESELA